jgi:hypothetical protein
VASQHRGGLPTAVWFGRSLEPIEGFCLASLGAKPVAGLRFYMNTFVVPCDVGFGKETTGLYFNFGQVF